MSVISSQVTETNTALPLFSKHTEERCLYDLGNLFICKRQTTHKELKDR